MNLFEIESEIKKILEGMEVNEDTGEVTGIEGLEELQLAKEEKIRNTALYYLNLISDANELAEQEKKFRERKQSVQKKAERIKEYLSAALNGEGYRCTECAVKFSRSKRVEVTPDFIRWAKENADEYLTYKEPEPNKTAIKAAIECGKEIPGAKIAEYNNISIK